MTRRLFACTVVFALALVDCSTRGDGGTDAGADVADVATLSADWVIALDPSQSPGALAPSLLGQYDICGALIRYDQQAQLPPLMKAAGMAQWRVGVGRWEFGTQLLPKLTDGTSCLPLPAEAQAPPNATDLDLRWRPRARDRRGSRAVDADFLRRVRGSGIRCGHAFGTRRE